jgi:hypothetical protein
MEGVKRRTQGVAPVEIDFAEAGGIQDDTPVSRKRLIEELGQERSIYGREQPSHHDAAPE